MPVPMHAAAAKMVATPGAAATRPMPAAMSSRPAVVPLLSVTALRSRSLPIHGCVSTEPSATTLTAAVPAKASMPWRVARAGRKPTAAPSAPVEAARTSVGTRKRRSPTCRARSTTVYRFRGSGARCGTDTSTHTAVTAASAESVPNSSGNPPARIRPAPSGGPMIYPRLFQEPYRPK